jgi:hypothetical protein
VPPPYVLDQAYSGQKTGCSGVYGHSPADNTAVDRGWRVPLPHFRWIFGSAVMQIIDDGAVQRA